MQVPKRYCEAESEHDQFVSALKSIFRADPKAVQASMDADKEIRAEKRKARKSSSSSAPDPDGRV